MLVAAFFRCLYIPRDTGHFLTDFLSGAVKDLNGIVRQFGVFAVIHIDGISGICHERGHVGSKEVFSNADTDDQRAGFAHGKDLARLIRADHTQRVGAPQTVGRLDQGFSHISVVVHFN